MDALDLLTVFPPLAGAIIVGLFSRTIGDRAAQIITCGLMLVALIASIPVFNAVALHGEVHNHLIATWIKSGTFEVSWRIHIDTLTAVMLLVVNGVSAMVHLYSVGYMAHDKSVPRFMSYLSLFTFFMLMLVSSSNLLQMFFGWEGVGLASYLLIGYWYEKPSAQAAAIKAFLVNRVGDFGFVLGIFACYALFGTIRFSAMFGKIPEVVATQFTFLGHSFPALTVACLLLFVGAMGKSAQLGLHTWLPDAMEGPTPVSALIHAATMVTAGVFMVARLSPLFQSAPFALMVVTIVGALTCIVAGSIGLTQFDIKRVIAYSTMSQLGYMFFAAGVSAYSAAIFHLMTHAFFKALLFLAAGSVIHAFSGEQDMRKMGGVWKKIPITYALMWIGSLALAGIGLDDVFGMSGFYSKDLILESAIANGHWYGTFAYVLGIITVFFTAFYSWRLLIMTFHGPSRADHHTQEHVHESSWVMLGPLVPLALGAIFAGYFTYDWFAGPERFVFWNNAIFQEPATLPCGVGTVFGSCVHPLLSSDQPVLVKGSVVDAMHITLFEKWLPLGLALAGIFLAYVFYMWKTDLPGKVARSLGGLYRLVFNKYYFDELYDFVFVRGAEALAVILWKKGDDGTIDRFGPDGVARLTARLGKRTAALQTGYVYTYAFAMVIGVAAFVAWFWARG
jgi:NADH-quinone oxidoreductase subunit L